MPAAAIFKGLTTMNALADFLVGGGVTDALAATEFAAARKAFREVEEAADKRGQLWVCIGHLNSCLEANRSICAGAESNLKALSQFTMLQSQRLESAGEKIRFILCLLAVCYAYLGERKLAMVHFDAAIAAGPVEASRLGQALSIGYAFSQLIVPTIILEVAVDAIRSGGNTEEPHAYQISEEDVQEIRRRISRLRTEKVGVPRRSRKRQG